MALLAFLERLRLYNNIPEQLIISFIGRECPFLFFSQVILFLQKNGVLTETISIDNNDIVSIHSYLSTASFMGQNIFLLKDVHLLPTKKQHELITYLQSYNGPHKIICFFKDESSIALLKNTTNALTIAIPDEFSLQDISIIRFLISNDRSKKAQNSIDAGLQVQPVSLDTLCLLNHYELVAGNNWNTFFTQWGPYILEPTSSLFLLSQYFFGKKSQLFFKQWSHVCDIYTPTFWPTFWADQLWRAYIFCDLMQHKQYDQAKKAQYKLPYSFIKRDWNALQLHEIQQAHLYLFTLDYRLKNGGSFAALELFFGKFFDGKFRV